MDKLPVIEAATISAQHLDNSENSERAQFAAMMAARLFDYFGPPEVGEPKVLLAGAVKMFMSYPREVVEAVVDPIAGLPTTMKWAPKLFEIRQALDIELAPVLRRLERERQIAEQLEARKAIPDMRPRPTYEELQRRCAEAGLYIGQGPKPVTVKEIRETYGISQAQWDAIPNAAKFTRRNRHDQTNEKDQGETETRRAQAPPYIP